jgi:uncharacterized small protein (DUF1192 family)
VGDSIIQKDNTIRNLQAQLVNKTDTLFISQALTREKEAVVQDLRSKLVAKDTVVQDLNERIGLLQTALTQAQAHAINPLELELLKEQLEDKKSIIALIKDENKIFKIKAESNRIKAETYKMKAEQLKTKLANYTADNISISESAISVKVSNDASQLQSEIDEPMFNSEAFGQNTPINQFNQLIPNDTVESVFLANDNIQFEDSQLVGASEPNSFSMIN